MNECWLSKINECWLSISTSRAVFCWGEADPLFGPHLFAYGLQVSVPDKVFSELYSGEPGAARIWEQLEEALLWFKVAVCVDQLHVSAHRETNHEDLFWWTNLSQQDRTSPVRTCWPACRRSRWGGRCLSADRAGSWTPGSTWSSSGSSGRRRWSGTWGCPGHLLLWLPCWTRFGSDARQAVQATWGDTCSQKEPLTSNRRVNGTEMFPLIIISLKNFSFL